VEVPGLASTRPKGLTRKTGMNVVPVVIYIAAAVVITVGMYAWDVTYRRSQEEARKPPPPETIVKNLVESSVGADTVKEVKVDRERKLIALTVESTQFKPDRSKKLLRETLEAEALITAGLILTPPSPLREFERVTVTLVREGKTLAVGEAVRGQGKIAMTYVDERLKD
jgi:hypothetical protein